MARSKVCELLRKIDSFKEPIMDEGSSTSFGGFLSVLVRLGTVAYAFYLGYGAYLRGPTISSSINFLRPDYKEHISLKCVSPKGCAIVDLDTRKAEIFAQGQYKQVYLPVTPQPQQNGVAVLARDCTWQCGSSALVNIANYPMPLIDIPFSITSTDGTETMFNETLNQGDIVSFVAARRVENGKKRSKFLVNKISALSGAASPYSIYDKNFYKTVCPGLSESCGDNFYPYYVASEKYHLEQMETTTVVQDMTAEVLGIIGQAGGIFGVLTTAFGTLLMAQKYIRARKKKTQPRSSKDIEALRNPASVKSSAALK